MQKAKTSQEAFDLDTPIVSPAFLATRRGVSVDMVEAAAQRLAIAFSRTPGGWRRMSFRDAQRLDDYLRLRGREGGDA